jgi:hypothetical protein
MSASETSSSDAALDRSFIRNLCGDGFDSKHRRQKKTAASGEARPFVSVMQPI